MKKKMRIKLSANCVKCRRKAMEVAVSAHGVISVAIEGEYEDELVVVGEGVDAACLVDTLRKKACYATLETLEEVIPEIPPPDNDDLMNPQEDNNTDNAMNIETNDDDDADDNDINQTVHQCPSICYGHPHHEMYEVVYESYGPTTGCIIM